MRFRRAAVRRPLRTGFVYFVRARRGGPVKIGWARDPADRLRHLQAENAQQLELLAVMPGTQAEEHELHRRFAHARLHGEWFRYCQGIGTLVQKLRAEHGEPVAGFLLPEELALAIERSDRVVPVWSAGG